MRVDSEIFTHFLVWFYTVHLAASKKPNPDSVFPFFFFCLNARALIQYTGGCKSTHCCRTSREESKNRGQERERSQERSQKEEGRRSPCEERGVQMRYEFRIYIRTTETYIMIDVRLFFPGVLGVIYCCTLIECDECNAMHLHTFAPI